MLTHNDGDRRRMAVKVYELAARTRRCDYVGFKDIGATPDVLAEVAEKAHDDGLEVMLEVVSTVPPMSRDRVARGAGATSASTGSSAARTPTTACASSRGSGIKYCPFPGASIGHPSVLLGAIGEIAEHAATLTAHRRRLRSRPARLPAPAGRPGRTDPRRWSWPPKARWSSRRARSPRAEQIVASPRPAPGASRSAARSSGALPGAPDLAGQISEVLPGDHTRRPAPWRERRPIEEPRLKLPGSRAAARSFSDLFVQTSTWPATGCPTRTSWLARFEVSRATIREAVRGLVEAGYLDRKPRARHVRDRPARAQALAGYDCQLHEHDP